MTNPIVNLLHIYMSNKLKPVRFKVESISNEYFDMLLSNSDFPQDFIGDKKSWALSSINSLVKLSVSSTSWIKIFKSNENIAPSTIKDLVKEMTPANPDSIEKETSDEDEGYLIQCVAASTVPKDLHLYVTEEVYFNMKHHLGLDSTDLFSIEVDVKSETKGYRPERAKTAVVAAINAPFEVAANDSNDILHEYFSRARYLRKGDCFSVSLKKNAPHLTYNSSYRDVSQITFKVIDLAAENGRLRRSVRGYYVGNFTDLFLDPPVAGYLIPEASICVKTPFSSGYQLSICPDGLKKHFDLVKQMFVPFFKSGDWKAKPVFLLSGAHGSGKKTVLRCASRYFGLKELDVDCFDFYGAGSSVAEAKFEVITSKVKKLSPCLLLLHNVELIGRDRERNEDVRLVSAFQHHVKELFDRKSDYPIFVVGTTDSKPSELVPSVARTFLQTIVFGTPKSKDAYANLNWFAAEAGVVCEGEVLKKVSEKTTGFVFADLSLLFRHALRFQREDEKVASDERHLLLPRHFERGLEIMESAYSDSIGAAKVPTVRWEDVGGLEDLKEEIMVTMNLPLKHPELFSSGLKRSGILFYGPPGTGKTLMAKAVATECNFNFLSVKGPELMNMYVGQSEKNVREVFERARDASPCIIFFDELDSLAPNRGKSGDSGGVTDRVVSQLLAEMDGLQENNRVFVVAATNRPDLVDPALLRPGRFDKMFYVGVCDNVSSKLSVVKALTRKFILGKNVNFEKLISKLPGHLTGADIYSVCSNAWLAAARRNIDNIEKGTSVSVPIEVVSEDFELAITKFVPSLSLQDVSYYQKLKSLER